MPKSRYREHTLYREHDLYEGLAPTAPSLDKPAPHIGVSPLPAVSWTLGGVPVRIMNWSASAVAMGGYDQMRGEMIDKEFRAIPNAGQGTVVTAYQQGQVLYQGRLAALPQMKAGRAYLAASGWKVQAEKRTDRLLIQSRDHSIWTPVDAEPHHSNGVPVYYHNRNINASTTRGRLNFDVAQGVALNAAPSTRNGFVFYAEGQQLGRVNFFMHYVAGDIDDQLVIDVDRANGPVGGTTNEAVYACNAGNQDSQRNTILFGGQDSAHIYLRVLGTHTPGTPQRYTITSMVVNSNIYEGDFYSPSDLMSYVAGQLGWHDETTASIFYMLPFDWTGTNWAEMASYVSELEDHYWRVLDDAGQGPRLQYDAWGTRNWTVNKAQGAVIDLMPLEVFNQVLVRYKTATGVERKVTVAASPDPLLGTGEVNTYEYQMLDPQGTASTVPAAVAAKLLARFSVQRYSGRIDLVRALDAGGTNNPFGISPGDTVTVSDFDNGVAANLRVMDAEYRATGVTLGVEEPVNLANLIARTHHHRRRH